MLQDRRGVLWIAGSNGVISYDGATWRSIELPNQGTVRSLDMSRRSAAERPHVTHRAQARHRTPAERRHAGGGAGGRARHAAVGRGQRRPPAARRHTDLDPKFPVTHDGLVLGSVSGGEHAKTVAAVLDHLVAREAERKALGAEVLHLYREVNLIYSFSEKLAALLELERVAALTLREGQHIIAASDGAIMLLDEQTPAISRRWPGSATHSRI